MFQLECCGVESPNDWGEKQRPLSCCHGIRENAGPPQDFHCRDAVPGDDILYKVGCMEKLGMKASDNAKILIGVGIGIAFIEVNNFIDSVYSISMPQNKRYQIYFVNNHISCTFNINMQMLYI